MINSVLLTVVFPIFNINCLSNYFRVLHIDNGNVIVTLKPTQVESNQCLVNASQAKRGEKFPGVVVQTKEEGALVVFYNNVKGWINKKQLGSLNDLENDPRKYFFKGQVVSNWVL